jgi:hypothetical protein
VRGDGWGLAKRRAEALPRGARSAEPPASPFVARRGRGGGGEGLAFSRRRASGGKGSASLHEPRPPAAPPAGWCGDPDEPPRVWSEEEPDRAPSPRAAEAAFAQPLVVMGDA